eukprot:scaffold4347_cov117-Cylindrotheca_fusiformis.AAC.15
MQDTPVIGDILRVPAVENFFASFGGGNNRRAPDNVAPKNEIPVKIRQKMVAKARYEANDTDYCEDGM